MRAFLLALALVLAAPASGAPDDAPFEPEGELVFILRGDSATSASFDRERVVGPSVNLTRREGGGWAGDLLEGSVDLVVTEDRITGANVDLHVERKGGATGVRGIFLGRRVSVAWSPKDFGARFGGCSVDLVRKGPGLYEGDVGCVRRSASLPSLTRATLKLSGEAALGNPPVPQFALALIAILPR